MLSDIMNRDVFIKYLKFKTNPRNAIIFINHPVITDWPLARMECQDRSRQTQLLNLKTKTMSFNKNERDRLVNEAKKDGYTWNSSGSTLVNGNKSITFSNTGGSAKVGGSTSIYNTVDGVKKSRNY